MTTVKEFATLFEKLSLALMHKKKKKKPYELCRHSSSLNFFCKHYFIFLKVGLKAMLIDLLLEM